MQISSRFTIGVHLLAVTAYLGESGRVTSKLLAGSIGVNPVIVRNLMGSLKQAGLISISRGKSGIELAKSPESISFYDVYLAVDCVKDEGIFHFHESPNPDCPIGRNIHHAMDERLEAVQRAMEAELKKISLADVMADIRDRIAAQGGE